MSDVTAVMTTEEQQHFEAVVEKFHALAATILEKSRDYRSADVTNPLGGVYIEHAARSARISDGVEDGMHEKGFDPNTCLAVHLKYIAGRGHLSRLMQELNTLGVRVFSGSTVSDAADTPVPTLFVDYSNLTPEKLTALNIRVKTAEAARGAA